MGAETETDGQGDAMKRKRYKLYDNYTTYYILVGIALMYALLAALNIWIYKKCDAVSEKIALMPKASIAGVRAGGALRFGGMKFVHMALA